MTVSLREEVSIANTKNNYEDYVVIPSHREPVLIL